MVTRAKAKLNRLWVSVAGNGNVQGWWPKRPAKHPSHGKRVRVVECITMPRVTVRELPEDPDRWECYSVRVNGVEILATAIEPRAKEAARNLRRALRGK